MACIQYDGAAWLQNEKNLSSRVAELTRGDSKTLKNRLWEQRQVFLPEICKCHLMRNWESEKKS